MPTNVTGLLLISDVDGTLFSGDLSVSPRNLAAIERIRAAGGLFTFASGRPVYALRPWARRFGVRCPAAAINGAVLYDFGAEKLLWQEALPRECVELAAEIGARFPAVGIEGHTEARAGVLRWSPEGERHVLRENMPYAELTAGELAGIPCNKMLFAAPAPLLEEIRAYLQPLLPAGTYLVRTSDVYLELLPDSADKGRAVERLAELFGVPREKLCCIGDYDNDIPMLACAARSACPADGRASVRERADYVVGPAKDGAVADFIKILMGA